MFRRFLTHVSVLLLAMVVTPLGTLEVVDAAAPSAAVAAVASPVLAGSGAATPAVATGVFHT